MKELTIAKLMAAKKVLDEAPVQIIELSNGSIVHFKDLSNKVYV